MAPANDPVGTTAAMILIAGCVLVIGWALWASSRDRRRRSR